MVVIRGASKRYGNQEALRTTDLEVKPGQTTVLIGPSGCGKSTLLRLIIGLIEPTSGEIILNDRPVRSETLSDIRRQVGYVIQDGGLFPHLTAEQNITIMARQIGRETAAIRKRLHELCTLTRFLKEGLTRYPGELSGGQRQRVGLMRALMLDPLLLLLDEPLGALDPIVRAGLQTDLKTIFAELGKTVILVTHDMGEAGYLGDRIVLMRDGAIVQQGELADLRDRPVDPFVTEFLNAQKSLIAL